MVSPRQGQRVGQQLGDVPYRQGIVLGRQAVFQHGQAERAVATASAPVSRACSARMTFMRRPSRSSSHMRPPPAPQQKLFSRVRSISTTWAPHAFTTVRGSSYTSA